MKLVGIFYLVIAALITPSAFAARAVYEVPVPAELKKFSRYEFDEIRVEQSGDGQLHVRYQLPLALTGAENHLRFEGPVVNGVAKMSNASGDMTCVLAVNLCHVKYKALDINAAKAEATLRALDFTEMEVLGHLGVTARFGGDMEGVIHSAEIH